MILLLRRYCGWLVWACFIVAFSSGMALAAEAGNDYLVYQEPQTTTASWVSTVAYVVSLLVTFAVIIGLAYFTSRFLGQRMGQLSARAENRILTHLPLGANRAIHVVEIAGKVLVLGVTDHSITLLQEITDEDQVEKLRQQQPATVPSNGFETILQSQLSSLQHMSQRFPSAFGRRHEQSNEREKR